MVTPDLISSIRRKMDRGSSPDQIRESLSLKGWDNADIERALRLALGPKGSVALSAMVPVQTLGVEQGPLLAWLFRVGFAGVFLVNSIVAIVDPSGFVKLMQSSFMGAFIHDFQPFVGLIAVNDFTLGLLILSGRWQNYVLAWSGLWLLAVTLIKLSSLIH